MSVLTSLFKEILEVSLFASAMITIVLLIKKIAKDRIDSKIVSFLWLLVILRLCIPGMLESPVHTDSMFPAWTDIQKVAALSTSLDETAGNYQSNSMNPYAIKDAASPMGGAKQSQPAMARPEKVPFYEQVLVLFRLLDVWSAVAVVWVMGVAIVLASVLKESIAFTLSIQKNSRPLADPEILAIVAAHKQASRLRRCIRVSVCSTIQMPLAFGVLRPRILLPLGLMEVISREHLQAILLHEVCHIKRNDILKGYAYMLAKALHWFNPLVWISLRKIKTDMEFACDQSVLKLMKSGQKVKYCESLLLATRFKQQREIPQFATSLCESKSNLKDRIAKMISPQKKSKSAVALSLALALMMFVACFTTACQPTPQSKAIVQRQDDVLENVTAGHFEKIEAPEHLSEVHDDFAKLRVAFEADVNVPETTAYPVTEVTKKTFSDDNILSLIQLLCGTNKELYAQWNLNKKECAQKLTKAKQYKGTERVTDDYLAYLQKQIENAPTEVQNPRANLSDLPADRNSSIYVKTGKDVVARFVLWRKHNQFIYYRDMFLQVYPASQFADGQYNERMDGPIENFMWPKPGEPEISQQDAYSKALEYMNSLDADLTLYRAEPCGVLVDQVDKTTGWQFTFTRAISNLQTQYKSGQGLYLNPDAYPSYGSPWGQEFLVITIDKNGLCSLWWNGASTVSRTITGSAQLEPFETITQRMADQLNYIYGTMDNGSGGADMEITGIQLGLSLISVKDRADTGVYLPTWYVSFRDRYRNAEEWAPGQIMFSAVDGSYIEPRVSNDDLMRPRPNDNTSVGSEN